MRQEITSRGNEKVKRLRLLAKDSALRKKEGEFVAEGPHLLQEALKERAPITAVYAAMEKPPEELSALSADIPIYLLPGELLESVAPAQTTQGVVFTCRMERRKFPSGGRYLLLDGLADPGNVGTILRTADAFAFDGVLLTSGSADVYNPKTIRATQGAIFRLPVHIVEPNELERTLSALAVPLYAAVLEDSVPPEALLPACCCIAVGNEARGVSQTVLKLSDARIRIPMPGRAESLNAAVAAGILCYLAVQQR